MSNDVNQNLISVDQARKRLGKRFKSLTDEEIGDLVNQLICLAELATDMIILQGSNKQPEVIDPSTRKEQNGVK